MRLAKFLAGAGVASRRASESLVRSGRVTVGGVVVEDPARDVSPGDDVAVDGARVSLANGRVVFALHKPAGVVSTASDPQGRPTVVALAQRSLGPAAGRRLFPVGRLDLDSTGLLLLTDDGALAYRLTHPRFEVPKTYRVRVANPPLRTEALRALRAGVRLEDGATAPAQVRRVGPATLEITIHEGRKRQVRRMCEAVGHPVVALTRVAFGPLRLGDLPEGALRRLTAAEVRALAGAGRDVTRTRQAATPRPPRRTGAGHRPAQPRPQR